jgi:putative MFS transporter
MNQGHGAAGIAARLEALGETPGLRRLVACVSAGGWFEFYDLFMTGYIALGLVRHGLFTATGTSLRSVAAFSAAGFGGMFAGTLAFGWIADRVGRRSTFAWSLVAYSVCTAAMALSRGPATIDLWRCLAGIGIGVQIVTIDAYISEIAPKEVRGRMIALSQAITYTAVPVVAFLSYALVPHAPGGLEGWRWVALAGAGGALFAWPLRAGLPESPRWLASRGKLAQAYEECAAIERAGERRGGTVPATSGPHIPVESTLSRRAYAGRAVVLSAFNVVQTVGFYGFAAWVPLLLYTGGVTFVHSLAYTSWIALVTPVGPLLAMRVADLAERKWQIAGLALISAVFGLGLARAAQAWSIVACGAAVTIANTWFSCAFHAYQAELFPTRARSGWVGLVYSWSRLSSALTGYWLAFVVRTFSTRTAFVSIALAMLVAAALIAGWGPRTNRRTLEALAPERM